MITLHCIVCPFWHFGPYWLGMRVVCRNAWCHIFDGDTYYFYLFIFQCDVFSCLSSSWYRLVIQKIVIVQELCLVMSFVSYTYVWWFLHERDVPHFIWYTCCMLCLLPILSEHGLWLDGKWFCLFDIRFVDDFWYGLTYNVVTCTISI